MTDNKKQWYLIILATVWLLISLALAAGAFYITRDLRSFALTAPPIAMLQHLYRYHFPLSRESYYKHKETMTRLKLEAAQEESRRRQGLAGEPDRPHLPRRV